MSLVSFDGHSLMIDGRRVWLVSGSLHYARLPRQRWAEQLDAARRAGLNCISTDAVWSVHEPERGTFDFEGDLDLAHFIGLLAERDMHCILRPGPHLGGGWSGGGIPAWLRADPTVLIRSTGRDHPRFLEASGRYFAALMEQVRPFLATAPEGGPVLLVQAEHEWFCDPPATAASYLNELLRHLREHGCDVPVTMANNMWTRVDGTIDTWNATEHLATDLRQLAIVQPTAPRLVSEFTCAGPRTWHDDDAPLGPDACLAKLAEILAAGAQFNLAMFHGGTNFGFRGGTNTEGIGYTATHGLSAPLGPDGTAGPLLPPVKAIATFASQFGHVLAHLHRGDFRAAVAPNGTEHVPSVIHQRGNQGDVVFIIRPPSARDEVIELMLPNGLTLPVPMGRDAAAWVLLEANIGAIALNYANLRPWAWLGQQLLAFYGPAGATGHLSVNEAPMTVTVPTGNRPVVERHEETTIVVLNHAQMVGTTLLDDGLIVGADGVDDTGQVRPHAGARQGVRIHLDGSTETVRFRAARPQPTPRLTQWQHAGTTDFVEGSAAAYTDGPGPCSLDAAGAPDGYGWYRIEVPRSAAGQMLPLGAGDRVHFYRGGRLERLWGQGPGADASPFPCREHGVITALADNLGRRDGGPIRDENKGLFDHLFIVKPVRLGRATQPGSEPPDPFLLGGYLHGIRAGDVADAGSYAWRVATTGSMPLVVELDALPARGMLVVNGTPVGIFLPHLAAGRFVLRMGEQLRRRSNELRLAFFDEKPTLSAVNAALSVFQATRNLTGSARWSFAPWGPPDDDAFGPLPGKLGGSPRWFRSQMGPVTTAGPLWLDVSSLSKGQLYLNGRNLCRYFAQTATRRAVDAHKRCLLPAPWLNDDEPNMVTIFDEHGFRPTGCRLYRSAG